MPFTTLGLAEPLLRAIRERHYLVPTPIQREVIPLALHGRDIRACAQTGSGKTAAFAWPILQQLLQARRATPRQTAALIVVPTRELAQQVADAFRAYAIHLPDALKIAAVFGGVSINPQMMALRGGAEVVVATPGRLLDLVEQHALQLDAVATLVLDEADKLLELGFAEELARVLALLPRSRQTLLFSATYPPAVQVLAAQLLREPAAIEIAASAATTPAIAQRAITVDTARRTALLRQLILEQAWSRVLVFVATKYATEHVAEKLRRAGINAACFHGELSQGARTQTLADFKAAKLRVVVATDVAARGIDIAQLPAVVNYDLPRSAFDYVHRIGRTGRAGEAGVAVSFVSAAGEAHFRLIEKRNQLVLPREIIPGFEPQDSPPPVPNTAELPGSGGLKGRRKSKKDKLREAGLQPPAAKPVWAKYAPKPDPGDR